MVKNKSISLRREMNSILMQIQQKNFFCIDHQHGRLVTWLQTKNNFKLVSLNVTCRYVHFLVVKLLNILATLLVINLDAFLPKFEHFKTKNLP